MAEIRPGTTERKCKIPGCTGRVGALGMETRDEYGLHTGRVWRCNKNPEHTETIRDADIPAEDILPLS